LKWAGIKAGTAVLEVKKGEGGIMIISTARSADWISVFYPVEVRVVSASSKAAAIPNDLLPVSYRLMISKGKRKRDKEVIFRHDEKKAVFINHIGKREEVDIPSVIFDPLSGKKFPNLGKKNYVDIPSVIFDPLSGFYHLRNMELVPEKSVYLPVFDRKKVWNIEVQVLGREKIETPIGTFNTVLVKTVLVKPLMKSEGIFSKKGELFIWLTDDKNKIPVRLKSKVTVGSITAELISGAY
ncbi:MAG: DUF3108 domain-containing protein, partial [Thermodesulfovibrionales bacterium]|nr:DUF3108 domain-containing protein [Thermodesulfovibrionales bacterium]